MSLPWYVCLFYLPSSQYQSNIFNMQTRRTDINNMHTPPLSQIINAPLYICSRAVGLFDYSVLRPVPSFLSSIPQAPTVSKAKTYPSDIEKGLHPISNPAPIKLDEEYWKNDGVVPLFSQWHPLACGQVTVNLCYLQMLINSILAPRAASIIHLIYLRMHLYQNSLMINAHLSREYGMCTKLRMPLTCL